MALFNQGNVVLGQLNTDDYEAVTRQMSDFNFGIGHIFGEPNDDVKDIYFVDHGIISAVSIMANGETVEAYMVGFEGFTGATAWQIPFRTSVRYIGQLAGKTRRIEAKRLRDLSSERIGLRNALAFYDASLQIELEQAAPCNALHRTEQRFAKWLLRAHDRGNSDTLLMTQESLGNMLGSQRTTVNEAAQSLSAVGAISYTRGRVLIRDRGALERSACECYAAGKSILDRRVKPRIVAI